MSYLLCLHSRNMILSRWCKDVKHILDLAECGVSDVCLDDESPRQTLIRDVYLFLDQNVSCIACSSVHFHDLFCIIPELNLI